MADGFLGVRLYQLGAKRNRRFEVFAVQPVLLVLMIPLRVRSLKLTAASIIHILLGSDFYLGHSFSCDEIMSRVVR